MLILQIKNKFSNILLLIKQKQGEITMERIKLLTKETASEKAKEVLEGIERKNGKVINIFKAMANSSAVLKTYFNINKALEEKTLDNATAERIAIWIANVNGCEYCNAAHSFLAKELLSEDEIAKNRDGKSSDAKAQSALEFAQVVMKNAGKISDDDFEKVKLAGYTDGEILEIATLVSLNFFTNAINNIAQTKVDFPKIQK